MLDVVCLDKKNVVQFLQMIKTGCTFDVRKHNEQVQRSTIKASVFPQLVLFLLHQSYIFVITFTIHFINKTRKL